MLSVSDLSCVRGDKRLFSGVSFSLKAGEWLHLQGDNGTGKTSLLRIVCGLAHAHGGVISWQGQPIAEDADSFRAALAYLGHNLALKEELSALENLQTDAAIAGRHLNRTQALSALAQLGLRGREHLPVRVLSQGQKRRAALARMIASHAALWVMDEPFVALDKHAQDVLASIISDHVARGGMALFTSHQPVDMAGHGLHYRLQA
jgi:heme exporter protein A